MRRGVEALKSGATTYKRVSEYSSLERMLQLAVAPPPAAPGARVIPIARYLRPASQYALPPAGSGRGNPGEDE